MKRLPILPNSLDMVAGDGACAGELHLDAEGEGECKGEIEGPAPW